MTERDCWATPTPVFNEICQMWGIYPQIDVCADEQNRKCVLYIDEKMDALHTDWMQFARSNNVAPVFWMNPPYTTSIMVAFIEKAIQTAHEGGTTVFLLPAWVERPWFHDKIYKKTPYYEIYPKRIRHIPPPGIKEASPRYGSIHGLFSEKAPIWTVGDEEYST